ncbi:MAG: hypothetical protein SPG55_03670 [Prevotella sp.]|nr:hypothetical protein [Prevotella sp.]MCI7581014.1 hypothetical protein [Prevotella sp.]MDD7074851.1 hypothetical protein [Prevotellaceae bacterium]MDY5343292.1 hypothetical protein [Prevotella sp.]
MGSIQGDDNVCIVILVEETHQMQLSFVTDDDMRRQLSLRLHKPADDNSVSKLLPEVMWESLRGFSDNQDYEMVVESVGEDGEYHTILYNKIFGSKFDIRLADAVLMQEVTGIPLYIKLSLLRKQMVPYTEGSNTTTIPINVMPLAVLEKGLTDSIAKEDYHMAQRLKDEINKRKSLNNQGGKNR